MPSLEQYGYHSIDVGSHRPLVVVLAQGADRVPLAHDKSYYHDVIFGAGLSVVNYFSAISNGRFTFTSAGEGVYGPIQLTKAEMDLPLAPRIKVIRNQLVLAGFNIDNLDLNRDAMVDEDELAMLIIDSDSKNKGVTNHTAPPSTFFLGRQSGWQGAASAVGHQSSLMNFCHELLHTLGVKAEMYGSAGLNMQYTTMGPTIFGTDDRRTWHLDPFHKMKLGWCEPRLYDANNVGSVVVRVHRSDNPDAQVLLYDGRDELSRRFFMVEYRTSKTPFDEDVASNGIGIWRVELDADLNPYRIPGSNNKTDWSVNLQGPPSWHRGKGPLWRAGKTPFFEWMPKCALDIHLFDDSQGQVQVDITLPQ